MKDRNVLHKGEKILLNKLGQKYKGKYSLNFEGKNGRKANQRYCRWLDGNLQKITHQHRQFLSQTTTFKSTLFLGLDLKWGNSKLLFLEKIAILYNDLIFLGH